MADHQKLAVVDVVHVSDFALLELTVVGRRPIVVIFREPAVAALALDDRA